MMMQACFRLWANYVAVRYPKLLASTVASADCVSHLAPGDDEISTANASNTSPLNRRIESDDNRYQPRTAKANRVPRSISFFQTCSLAAYRRGIGTNRNSPPVASIWRATARKGGGVREMASGLVVSGIAVPRTATAARPARRDASPSPSKASIGIGRRVKRNPAHPTTVARAVEQASGASTSDPVDCLPALPDDSLPDAVVQFLRREGRHAVFSATKVGVVEVNEVEGGRSLRAYMSLPASQYSTLDGERVERVGDDTFVCTLGAFDFLGFRLQPVLTARVDVRPDGYVAKSCPNTHTSTRFSPLFSCLVASTPARRVSFERRSTRSPLTDRALHYTFRSSQARVRDPRRER